MSKTPQEIQARYAAEIDKAVEASRSSSEYKSVYAKDGSEAYAYPKDDGATAWGVSDGETGRNVVRGVREANGVDVGVH
jgi:hypothetical protein